MSNPNAASVETVGGYPVFDTKDSAGTRVLPVGNYVYNASISLWIPAPTDANGNPQMSVPDGADVTQGAKSDTAVTDPTLSASEMAVLKGILKQLQGNGTGSQSVSLTGSNALNAALQKISVSNTATQLPNISCREITLIAQKDNSGTVYVGGSNVLYVPAPTSAPTLSTVTTGGSVAGNITAYVKYTWVTANGETLASPEANIVIPNTTNTNTITVTMPTFPNGVTSANMYISTSSGSETKQGSTASATYTQTTALTTGAALPAFGTANKYGVALDPKDSETFTITNADMIYIYGTAGDGVSYVAV